MNISVIDLIHQFALDTLTQVASIAQYGDAIAADYDLYLAATVIALRPPNVSRRTRTTARIPSTCFFWAHFNASRGGRHDPTPHSYLVHAARSPWPDGRPPVSTAPCAAPRDPTPRSPFPTEALSVTPVVRPAPRPRPTRWHSWASCSAATGSAPTAARRTRAPRPSAPSPRTPQWHLKPPAP